MVYIAAFFVVNVDNLSQLRVLAMMRDKKNGNVNIAHYMSCKRKRVCEFVRALKLFAFFEGFDVRFVFVTQSNLNATKSQS